MVLQQWPVFVRPRADVENGSRHLAAVSISTVCRVRYPWIRTLRHYLGAGIVLPGFFFATPDQLAFFRLWPAPCVTEVSERVRR